MRLMKNSGIEWIGDIPSDWNFRKLKSFAKIGSGEIISKDEYVSEGKYPVIGSNGEIGKTNKCNNFENVITTGRVGSVGTAHLVKYAWVTDNALILQTQNISQKFLCYVLPNFDYNFMISGTAQPLITATKLKNQFIPVPTMEEQKKIANFLDEKCAEIDTVIEKTKATIEEYKKLKQSVITQAVTKGIRPNRPLKDSGIEWIGEIPEDWDVKRGKAILSLLEKPVKESDYVITCFRDGQVTLRSNRREDGFTFSLQEVGYQGIDIGDLVVHGMDGFAGAIGISDSRGKGTPVLNVMDSTENKRYIMYYLRNMAYNGVFIALATGIRVRSCDTNWNKLKNLPYIVPSLSEQQEIVDYIDRRCSEVDELIAKKTRLLSELESYKKSLIYEYVTGKKEVKEPKCEDV